MNNGAEFVNSVKNIFLSEPITSNGINSLKQIGLHMTLDEFYDDNGVYIEPFSEYEKTENDSTEDDSDIMSYSDEIDLNVLKIEKENFENKINNLDGWLYIIKGVAGCGKTTYLNKLCHTHTANVIFHIFNFENTRQSFDFMSQSFDLKSLYKNNVCKFLSLLLIEIANLLSKRKYKLDQHRDYIKKIVSEYNRGFMVSEDDLSNSELSEPNIDITEQQEMFAILEGYALQQIEYTTLAKQLLDTVSDRLNCKQGDESDTLAFVIGFIIRLYYCIEKIDHKKHICVVDNIETFVDFDDEHPIQVCELETIINAFFIAAQKAREILSPWRKLENYRTFYSFLIVTRDTTASTALCAVQHEDDYKKENEVDISNWYCTQDILNSKETFFIKKGFSPVENCYTKAYQNILCDFSAYRWGLNGIITKMYKHSHRRNVECIPDAIAVVPESEIKYFNDMWEKTKGKDTSSLKSICRKYVLRLLIDHVQRKNYFSSLMVENSNLTSQKKTLETNSGINSNHQMHDESSSYARKVATLLHRVSLESGNERYLSFPRIIQSILKPRNLPDEPTNVQINNLAKILFLMNETRNEKTNWTSLVCMKFDNKEIYSENNLYVIMVREWEKYKQNLINIDDTSKYGVRITEAGSFFAKIIADFEYFSCRFLSNEPPLFSLQNIKPIYINNKKTYRAVAIINIIRRKAFSCIDEVMERDRYFYSSVGNNKTDFSGMYDNEYSCLYKETINDEELVHPLRILNKHMGYIGNYLDYIEQFVSEEKFEQKTDKRKLLSQIRGQLYLYVEKLQYLQENNPDYFKLHN